MYAHTILKPFLRTSDTIRQSHWSLVTVQADVTRKETKDCERVDKSSSLEGYGEKHSGDLVK
jgi:hypothetical protein